MSGYECNIIEELVAKYDFAALTKVDLCTFLAM